MSLYKVCKSIDYSSQEWLSYCQWRQLEFTSFDSLDSSTNECTTDTGFEDYWNYCVDKGHYLTDILNDLDYAKRYARKIGAGIILDFDFIDDLDSSKDIVGYDILDGTLMYSLLTNFGNDISIVNRKLGLNGLIRDKEAILEIHQWFFDNMKEDPHVIGSEICVVYEKIKEPFLS